MKNHLVSPDVTYPTVIHAAGMLPLSRNPGDETGGTAAVFALAMAPAMAPHVSM
ncbi:MAG: hypothetical protein ACRDTN_01505 [Mycobacterium sp.]